MIRGVNLLALLALITAGILTGIGELEPESFMLLVTVLAIPARADGHQNVGTGPQRVEVVNTANNPAAVEDVGDAGDADLPYLIVITAVAVIVVTIYHLLVT